MKALVDQSDQQPDFVQAERTVWITLIVGFGLGLSPFFACVTPFAAVATLAALKLSRRDMFVVVALVWVANQAAGYSILGYPWSYDSLAWGIAIGVASVLAALSANALATSQTGTMAISLPFIAALATFELALYAAAYVLPGGDAAFSAPVVGQVFLVNALALGGMITVYQAVMLLGRFAGRQETYNSAIPAAPSR